MKLIAQYRGELKPTGGTRHFANGTLAGGFDELQIVEFGPQEVNMLYFVEGEEVTDTGFESVEDALRQAEFEFGLTKSDWEFSPSKD